MTLRTTGRDKSSRALTLIAALIAVALVCAIQSASAHAASQYTQVSNGDDHSCAVTTTGSIECWGANDSGQLGDGTLINRTAPKASLIGSGATEVSAGSQATCAIVNGAAMCWGSGSSGQLGTGATPAVGQPAVVSGMGSGVTSISLGGGVACAVVNGAAKCWGSGYLGDGNDYSTQSSPVQVTGLTSGIQSIAHGPTYNACAVDVDSHVRCWGPNWAGQIGNDTVGSTELSPLLVSNLSAVSKVTVGSAFACAIHSGGAAVCWGYGGTGQLGTGTGDSSYVPVGVLGMSSGVTSISGGGEYACAIKSGAASCWGSNSRGQLGGTTEAFTQEPSPVSGIASGATAIAAGFSHACAVRSGAISCWGSNGHGQLGNGSSASSVSPVSALAVDSGVSKVSVGYSHSCAITSGAVKCWGMDSSGQLGDGALLDSQTAVQVAGLTSGATSVSSGEYMTCAVVNGAAFCWGIGGYGELGSGETQAFYSTPHQVTGLTSGVTSIRVGYRNVCAVVNGGAKCWGFNERGQLGDGTTVDSNVPVTVSGLGAGSGVTDIALGRFNGCAIVNGGAMCWGDNYVGSLGTGDEQPHLTPIAVPGLASGVTAIGVGYYSSCAIVSGAVKCTGFGPSGELGTGDDISHNTFKPVLNLDSGAVRIAISNHSACASGSFGARCWGANNSGQAGNGSTSATVPTPTDITPALTSVSDMATGTEHACAVVSSAVECWGEGSNGELGDGKAWTGTPQQLDQSVDTTSPAVTFTSGHRYTSTTPAISFSVADAHQTTTECKADSGVYASCTSPWTVPSALTLGDHTVTVKATDLAANVTEQSFAIHVGALASNVTFISPTNGSLVTSSQPSMQFAVDNSSGTNSTTQCTIDGGASFFCSSPWTPPQMSDGPHQFTVILMDTSYNFTEKSINFVIDASAPPVTVSSPAANTTTSNHNPTVAFAVGNADGDLASVKCSMDGATPAACSSPYTSQTLADGQHTLTVTATDTHGNARTVVVHFSVITPYVPPDPTDTSGGGSGFPPGYLPPPVFTPPPGFNEPEFTAPSFGSVPASASYKKPLTVNVTCQVNCTLLLSLKLGSKKANLPSVKVKAGTHAVKITFSSSAAKKIKAALKKKLKTTLKINAVDNQEQDKSKTIKLK